jgi:hypothetical protein
MRKSSRTTRSHTSYFQYYKLTCIHLNGYLQLAEELKKTTAALEAAESLAAQSVAERENAMRVELQVS